MGRFAPRRSDQDLTKRTHPSLYDFKPRATNRFVGTHLYDDVFSSQTHLFAHLAPNTIREMPAKENPILRFGPFNEGIVLVGLTGDGRLLAANAAGQRLI